MVFSKTHIGTTYAKRTMQNEQSFIQRHYTLLNCIALGVMIALITAVSFIINISVIGEMVLDPVILITTGILVTPGFILIGIVAYKTLKPALYAYYALKNDEGLSDEALIQGTRAIRRFPAYLAGFSVFWCFIPVPISFFILKQWYGYSNFFGVSYITVGVGTSLILSGTIFHFSKRIENNRIRHMHLFGNGGHKF